MGYRNVNNSNINVKDDKPKPTGNQHFRLSSLIRILITGQHRHDEKLPNAPKYQPCDNCGKWSKRVKKLSAGAIYKCVHHGEFLERKR